MRSEAITPTEELADSGQMNVTAILSQQTAALSSQMGVTIRSLELQRNVRHNPGGSPRQNWCCLRESYQTSAVPVRTVVR